jgi:hypothetical protein
LHQQSIATQPFMVPSSKTSIRVETQVQEQFVSTFYSSFLEMKIFFQDCAVRHKCKGKAVPQHTYKGAGRRRYSSYSFTASALNGGEWSASRPGRALPPRKGPPVPIGQEAGWAPEPVWTQKLEEKSSCLCLGSNFDRPVVQSVARHYTD